MAALQKVLSLPIWQGREGAFAKKAGIKPTHLSMIKSGRRKQPSLETWWKIAQAAGFHRFEDFMAFGRKQLLDPNWADERAEECRRGIPHREVAAIYHRLHSLLKNLGKNIDMALMESGAIRQEEDDFYFLGSPPNPYELEKICDTYGLDREYVWFGIPFGPSPTTQAAKELRDPSSYILRPKSATVHEQYSPYARTTYQKVNSKNFRIRVFEPESALSMTEHCEEEERHD